jgi:hypothetical protein
MNNTAENLQGFKELYILKKNNKVSSRNELDHVYYYSFSSRGNSDSAGFLFAITASIIARDA